MPAPRKLKRIAPVLAALTAAAAGDPSAASAQRLDPDATLIEAEVAGLRAGPEGEGQAVILRSKEKAPREVAIWIGPSEALAIHLRVEGRRYPRPLTHDLLQTIMDKLGGQVVKVEVHSLKSSTFLGRIHLKQGGKVHVLDARASDSIAAALGAQAKIYLSRPVLNAAGRRPDEARPAVVQPPPSTKL